MAGEAADDRVVINRITDEATKRDGGFIPAEDPLPVSDADEVDSETAEMMRLLGIHPGGKVKAKPELQFDENGPKWVEPSPPASSEPDGKDKKEEPAKPPEPSPQPAPTVGQGVTPPAPEKKEEPATPPPPTSPRRPPAKDKLAATLEKIADKLDRPTEPPKPEPVAQPIDDSRKLRLEAVALLEKEGKANVREYEQFLGKYDDYRKTWEAKHPGEDFDFEAEEHDDWRLKNAPRVSEEALLRAEARVEARRDFDRELQQLREEQLREKVEARASAAAVEAPGQLLAQFEADSIEKLKAKDPALARAVAEIQQPASELVALAHRVMSPLGRPDLRDPRQQALFGILHKWEAVLDSLPEDQTLSQGRRYVSAQDFDRIPPEQRAGYWTLRRDPAVASHLILSEFKNQAEQRAKELREWFGSTAAPAPVQKAAPTAEPPPPSPAATPAPPAAKPPSSTPGAPPSPVGTPKVEISDVEKWF